MTTSHANISHAQRVLGFRPHVPLRQGLCKFAMWFSLYHDAPMPHCPVAGGSLYSDAAQHEALLEPATSPPAIVKQLQAAHHRHAHQGREDATAAAAAAIASVARVAQAAQAAAKRPVNSVDDAEAPSSGAGLEPGLLVDAARALASSVDYNEFDCRKLKLTEAPPYMPSTATVRTSLHLLLLAFPSHSHSHSHLVMTSSLSQRSTWLGH